MLLLGIIIFLLFGVFIVVVKILILIIELVVFVVLIKLFVLNGLKIRSIMLVVKFLSEFCNDKLIVKLVVFNIVINDVVFMFSWLSEVIIINSIRMVLRIVFRKFISMLLYLDLVIRCLNIDKMNLIMILFII